jgi:hypothetical protein
MSETGSGQPWQHQGTPPPVQNIYVTQVQQARPNGCAGGCGALVGLLVLLAIIGAISQGCSGQSQAPSYTPSSNCVSQGGTNPDC